MQFLQRHQGVGRGRHRGRGRKLPLADADSVRRIRRAEELPEQAPALREALRQRELALASRRFCAGLPRLVAVARPLRRLQRDQSRLRHHAARRDAAATDSPPRPRLRVLRQRRGILPGGREDPTLQLRARGRQTPVHRRQAAARRGSPRRRPGRLAAGDGKLPGAQRFHPHCFA